jgi:hypothetical protein
VPCLEKRAPSLVTAFEIIRSSLTGYPRCIDRNQRLLHGGAVRPESSNDDADKTTWNMAHENREPSVSAASPVRNEGGPMKTAKSILFALTILLMATAVKAQEIKVRASVPFDFVVGDRAYPAGEYSFKAHGIVLQIVSTEQGSLDKVLSNACENTRPSDKTEVVFRHIGDNYFLYQVWVEGRVSGREMPRSRTEVRLAQNHEGAKSVIVAAVISQ